jgi:hypothetical protein
MDVLLVLLQIVSPRKDLVTASMITLPGCAFGGSEHSHRMIKQASPTLIMAVQALDVTFEMFSPPETLIAPRYATDKDLFRFPRLRDT